MAVNFHLGRRRAPSLYPEPLGRSWVGYDETRTVEELWEANRGIWSLGRRANDEQIATLSFEGVVVVVARISGREEIPTSRGRKSALSGTVLPEDDPIRRALLGRTLTRQRNPVSYFDSSIEERGVLVDDRAKMAHLDLDEGTNQTFLLTWNPERWTWDSLNTAISKTSAGYTEADRWSIGQRTSGITNGDRVFLLLQSEGRGGIVAAGTATGPVFQAAHWDDEREDLANFVPVLWDTVLEPAGALPRAVLRKEIALQAPWAPQASGTLLPYEAARQLETLWHRHLGRDDDEVDVEPDVEGPMSNGQRRQMDARRRKLIEDAAQQRLEEHFRERGWQVTDERYGNPYDAIARKGQEVRYLEAKGTQTAGTSVIVTRGEVDFARRHPGQCIMGIWSNIGIVGAPLSDKESVDEDSGTFFVGPWDPDDGQLVPRDFDWTPTLEA